VLHYQRLHCSTVVTVTSHFNGKCQDSTPVYPNPCICKHQNWHMWLRSPSLLTHIICLESVHGGLLYKYVKNNDFVTFCTFPFLSFPFFFPFTFLFTACQHSLLCRQQSAVLAMISSVWPSYRPTLRPSVCHMLVSCQNNSRYDHAVFTGK